MIDDEKRMNEFNTWQREKKRRAQIGLASFLAFLSFVFFQIRDELVGKYQLISLFGLLIPTSMAAVSGFMLLMLYLRGDLGSKSPVATNVHAFPSHSFSAEPSLHDLEARVNALEIAPKAVASQVNTDEAVKLLFPAVQQQLGQIFESQYEQKSAKAKAADQIGQQFNAAVKRLENEIAEQSRKGNVNLAIGVITTSLAIFLLAYIVLEPTKEVSTWLQLATHYIPRITLAVFIEVFSFFFLKLYKTTLDESRRYNDDLSRLTLQWVAVETGWFAEKDGETLSLAKDVLGLTKPSKVAAAELTSSVSGDKLAQAILNAVSKELGDKLKKDDKEGKSTKKGGSEDEE